MFRLGEHSSHSSSMASTAFLEFCHVWFCFLGDVILFGVVDCELSISRAKGIALIDDPGNLLKGIDKKTIGREGIESIKRVFICGWNSVTSGFVFLVT